LQSTGICEKVLQFHKYTAKHPVLTEIHAIKNNVRNENCTKGRVSSQQKKRRKRARENQNVFGAGVSEILSLFA
jgi:hypothetical protein